MILVRFIGGLGNQLFQYALGTHLATKNNTTLKIDTTLLLDRSEPHELVTHRELDIDLFHVQLNFATAAEIERFNGKSYTNLAGKIFNRVTWELVRKKKLIREQQRNFQPDILELGDNVCLVGAWQSEKYFLPIANQLRKEFTFKHTLEGATAILAKEIQACRSVCLNVRRGDYVTSPMYSKMLGALPAAYFEKALHALQQQQTIDRVYVFTDDAEWCREQLRFDLPMTIVGEEHNGPRFSHKLHLMTLCRSFIIPNSTYGWWAAWLGNDPNKKVVAPLHWFKDSTLNSEDLVPESWMRV